MISAKLNRLHFIRHTAKDSTISALGASSYLQAPTSVEPDYPLDSVQTRIWQEFVNGMQMLNQHVRRINDDVTQIVRSNIRLLQNNLVTSQQYKDLIATTKQNRNDNSLLTRWSIISSSKVQASLIQINHKIERSPQLSTQICYDYFNASDDFHGVEPAMSLFYLLSGKLCIEYSSESIKVIYNDAHTPQTALLTSRVIKSGEVLINPQHQDNLINISNKKNSTLLLAIHIAAKELS